MTRREGTFAAALCVTSAAMVAALKPVCIHETGDALDECLGALCHPTSMTGLQGYGACWENGKYKWAEGTFVTGNSELPGETHSYTKRATFGECWLSAHTHAEAKISPH